MKYPSNFIKKTKKILPNHSKLQDALDSGDMVVGKYLFEISSEIHKLMNEWVRFCRKKNILKNSLK